MIEEGSGGTDARTHPVTDLHNARPRPPSPPAAMDRQTHTQAHASLPRQTHHNEIQLVPRVQLGVGVDGRGVGVVHCDEPCARVAVAGQEPCFG